MAAVGLFYVQGVSRMRSAASPGDVSELAVRSEKMRVLEQENARLSAELQRIRETASTLKKDLDNQTATVEQQARRIPFRRQSPTVTGPQSEDWIEQAVETDDTAVLAQLEEAAMKNDHRALEALALLADQDQAAGLTRVWRSGLLNAANLVDATRYIAATLELNSSGEQLVRGLATDPAIDARTLSAAIDGLSNPSFPVTLSHSSSIVAPPHFKPDYAMRLRVLDALLASIADDNLRAGIDQAKADLQMRWTESMPVTP